MGILEESQAEVLENAQPSLTSSGPFPKGISAEAKLRDMW